MRLRLLGISLALVLGSLSAGGASAAVSLSALYQAVPPPPADVATAAGWVREGAVAEPQLLNLEAQLKAERASLALASGASAKLTGTPPEAGALAAAINGYKAYVKAHGGAQSPATLLGSRAKWLAGRFSGLRKRVSNPEDLNEIRTQELAAYCALFSDWQTSRRSVVARAESDLAPIPDPSAIAAPEQRAAVAQYRAAALGEIEVLLGLTRLAVEHAAGLKAAEPSTVPAGANTLWDLMSDPRKRPGP